MQYLGVWHALPNELALDPLSLHEVDQLTHALDVLANLKGAVGLDLRLT